jgi:uncharacterized cupin superfamily protein
MNDAKIPSPVLASAVPPRTRPSNYPEPFASRMARRVKSFGVNLTRLIPGGQSALMHRHSRQDEFVYIVDGTATLVSDSGEAELGPGMCVGFAAGGAAHHLVNRGDCDVVFLEIGDRQQGDQAYYPADDIQAVMGGDGKWRFAHKDGTPY